MTKDNKDVDQFNKVLDSLVTDEHWQKINAAARDKLIAEHWEEIAQDYLNDKIHESQKKTRAPRKSKASKDDEGSS